MTPIISTQRHAVERRIWTLRALALGARTQREIRYLVPHRDRVSAVLAELTALGMIDDDIRPTAVGWGTLSALSGLAPEIPWGAP